MTDDEAPGARQDHSGEAFRDSGQLCQKVTDAVCGDPDYLLRAPELGDDTWPASPSGAGPMDEVSRKVTDAVCDPDYLLHPERDRIIQEKHFEIQASYAKACAGELKSNTG